MLDIITSLIAAYAYIAWFCQIIDFMKKKFFEKFPNWEEELSTFYKEESVTDILCIELIKTRNSGETRPVLVSKIDHGTKTWLLN